MAVFWDVVGMFKCAYYLYRRPDDGITLHNIPEDSHLHTRRRENLKSHVMRFAYHWNCYARRHTNLSPLGDLLYLTQNIQLPSDL
jgi:hypothetical protein